MGWGGEGGEEVREGQRRVGGGEKKVGKEAIGKRETGNPQVEMAMQSYAIRIQICM